ncbi:hypothetical protein [Salinifilum ghardaiensis]
MAAAIAAITFLGVNLYFNGGHFIPPLDDTYIHMQYGRQIGQGEILRFQDGEPISTGASSLLYVFAVGLLYALGAHGSLLLPAAVVIGMASHVLAATCTAVLTRRLVGRLGGVCAGLLVALSGPLLWSAVSGMEAPVAAALVTGLLAVFAAEHEAGRFRWTPLVAVLAVLCRFEMVPVVVLIILAMLLALLRGQRSWPRRVLGAAWFALPLLALGGQLLFYGIATGSLSPNGNQAKSMLSMPAFNLGQFAGGVADNMRQFSAILAGISRQDFLFPGALLVAALGVAVLVRRPGTHRAVGLVLGGGVLLSLLAVSTLATALWQQVRYLHPFLPPVIVLVVVGAVTCARWFGRGAGRALAAGVLGTAGLFTLLSLPAWAHTVGLDTGAIRERIVSLATWTSGHLPPDARIGVHDVGAAAYLGRQPTVDLIGLTTNGLAKPAINGAGSLYEELSAMPPEERPDYFAIYDSMPGGVRLEHLEHAGLFGEVVLARQDMTVYRADYSSTGTGNTPLRPVPGEIRDHLDVGSMDSESAHDHAVRSPMATFRPTTDAATVETPRGRVADSNRHVYGAESFTLGNLTPHREATVTARHDASGPKPGAPSGGRAVRVFVDGTYLGTHELTTNPRGWAETQFSIPPELVNGRQVQVELKSPQEYVGPYSDYLSFGYWISQ